jgi:asparagine synthase (glutamine-hydrolysing)
LPPFDQDTEVADALRPWPGTGVRVERYPGAILGSIPIASDAWRINDRQPFALHDRQISVAGDYRLDNRETLRRALGIEGARSDSEILLSAYARWGSEMASRLVGDFAIAIWDWSLRELIVLRDHLGIKPVYYWVGKDEIAVASDVSILVDLVRPSLVPDDHLVVEHLLMQYRSIDRTFLSGMRRLPGGHRLKMGSDGLAVERFWSPPGSEIQANSTTEVHEELLRLFSRAVERRLDSAYPLAAHLSGGLDSSAIVCVADRIYQTGRSRPRLKAIGALYPGLECDESRFIETVARQVGFEVQTWDGRADGIFTLETPSIIGPGMGAQRAGDIEICLKMGARVLLSGQGGDHIGGCQGVPEDLARQQSIVARLSEICAPGIAVSRRVARLRRVARRSAPLRLRRLVGSVRGRWQAPSWLSREWRGLAGSLAADGYPSASTNGLSQVKGRHWEEVTAGSLGLALDSDQHRAAAEGVEIRYPFLDLEFVEYVLSLPVRHWPRPTAYGRLQREFLADILPKAVRTRSKAVFSSGVAYRMRLTWPRLRSLFRDGLWLSERYVNRESAQQLMERGERADQNDWPVWRAIWGIGTLEAWLRKISGYAVAQRRR